MVKPGGVDSVFESWKDRTVKALKKAATGNETDPSVGLGVATGIRLGINELGQVMLQDACNTPHYDFIYNELVSLGVIKK